jgi:GT2 family glycosyltransferase
MSSTDFLSDVLVVIVLFKTKPDESAACTSLRTALNISTAFPEIFIYDNSPHATPPTGRHITYHHDPANSGVSRAYNTASRHAGLKGKKWMLLLDQDTVVGRGYFEKLEEATKSEPGCVAFVPLVMDSVGLLSPFYFSRGKGKRMLNASGHLSFSKHRFVNSGLLIRCSAFVAAGGYDEAIPLDFSDIAFGQRLRSVTEHFCVVNFPLKHGFSGNERPNAEDALARFHYFCAGAYAMGKNAGFFNPYFLRAALRALNLFFRYKDPRFLRRCIQFGPNG